MLYLIQFSYQSQGARTVILSILQMRKTRLRKVKSLDQDHTTSKWLSQDLNCSLTPDPVVLTSKPSTFTKEVVWVKFFFRNKAFIKVDDCRLYKGPPEALLCQYLTP